MRNILNCVFQGNRSLNPGTQILNVSANNRGQPAICPVCVPTKAAAPAIKNKTPPISPKSLENILDSVTATSGPSGASLFTPKTPAPANKKETVIKIPMTIAKVAS